MPDTLVKPAHLWVPEHDRTLGPEVVDLASLAGLDLDGEQRLAVDSIAAVRPDGQWAAFEAGLVCSRQNLKTYTLEALALADLFLFDCELVVWTAHLFDTAQESFRHFEQVIDGCADLSREVKTIHRARGDEGVELMSGARLNIMARSKSAGRGLSGDSVTLDEAFALNGTEMGALMPTTSARPNPQIRYGSSAGMVTSHVLRGLRDRGRKSGDPSLAWLEWCAPEGGCAAKDCTHQFGVEGCALDDVDNWRRANPALGRRITVERIAAERRSLPAKEFARERLGWWEDPPNADGGAIDLTAWSVLASPDGERGARPVFGVDVDEDRMASVVVVTAVPGGHRAEMACEPIPAHRLPEKCVDLTQRWGGSVAAPTALKDDLERAGVRVSEVKSSVWPQASAAVVDAVTSVALRHGNQAELNEAARVVQWGPTTTSGARGFLLRGSKGAGPIFALTRALYVTTAGDNAPPNLW